MGGTINEYWVDIDADVIAYDQQPQDEKFYSLRFITHNRRTVFYVHYADKTFDAAITKFLLSGLCYDLDIEGQLVELT